MIFSLKVEMQVVPQIHQQNIHTSMYVIKTKCECRLNIWYIQHNNLQKSSRVMKTSVGLGTCIENWS